jgi:hypothetical protein
MVPGGHFSAWWSLRIRASWSGESTFVASSLGRADWSATAASGEPRLSVAKGAVAAQELESNKGTAGLTTEVAGQTGARRTLPVLTLGSRVRSCPLGRDALRNLRRDSLSRPHKLGSCIRDTCSPAEESGGKSGPDRRPGRHRLTCPQTPLPHPLATLPLRCSRASLLASGMQDTSNSPHDRKTHLEPVFEAVLLPPITPAADADPLPADPTVENTGTGVDGWAAI